MAPKALAASSQACRRTTRRGTLLRTQEPIWNARDKDRIVSPFARPLREQFVRDFTSAAKTLLTAVALLLVVTCANVASIMLARALARRREMAIRLAVGASRLRLARQLFVENLVLAARRWCRGACRRPMGAALAGDERRRSDPAVGQLRLGRPRSWRFRSL